jgi:hypothetical protein
LFAKPHARGGATTRFNEHTLIKTEYVAGRKRILKFWGNFLVAFEILGKFFLGQPPLAGVRF